MTLGESTPREPISRCVSPPRYPFPSAPNSWYHVAYSDELSREPLRVRAFGTELRIRRDAVGNVRVSDATFRTWPACERNGMVWAYHHAASAAPAFAVPEIPEATSDAWMPGGRIERTFKSHVQEIIENSIDLAHYRALHGFVGHATLEAFAVDGSAFSATIAARKSVFGVPVPGRLKLEYYGMGFGIGRMELPVHVTNVVTCLPVDDEHIRMRFTIFVRVRRVPILSTALARVLRWHLWHDVEGELPVFERKRYLSRPVLVPGDGPIMKVRSWCRQFYAASRAATEGV